MLACLALTQEGAEREALRGLSAPTCARGHMARHGPAQSSKEQDGGGGGAGAESSQHKKGLLLSNGRFSLITGIFA